MTAALKMHEKGLVHGNISPAHVLWLPSEASWTLIGLSNSTRIGKLMHVHDGAGLSLCYSCPEMAVAMRATAEMHAMRGFASAGPTGASTGEFGGESPLRGMSASAAFSMPTHGNPVLVAESGPVDGGVTDALSVVAEGVEVLAGAVPVAVAAAPCTLVFALRMVSFLSVPILLTRVQSHSKFNFRKLCPAPSCIAGS